MSLFSCVFNLDFFGLVLEKVFELNFGDKKLRLFNVLLDLIKFWLGVNSNLEVILWWIFSLEDCLILIFVNFFLGKFLVLW